MITTDAADWREQLEAALEVIDRHDNGASHSGVRILTGRRAGMSPLGSWRQELAAVYDRDRPTVPPLQMDRVDVTHGTIGPTPDRAPHKWYASGHSALSLMAMVGL